MGRLRGAEVAVDPRTLRRRAALVGLVLLGALVVVLILVDWQWYSSQQELKEHGVPVTVVVSGCRAHLTGSGSTVDGYTCHGRFVLGGASHDEDINGTTANFALGTRVAALVQPGDPRNLSLASSVRHSSPSLLPFLVPALLCVALVVLSLLWWQAGRRERATQGAAAAGSAPPR